MRDMWFFIKSYSFLLFVGKKNIKQLWEFFSNFKIPNKLGLLHKIAINQYIKQNFLSS